MGVEGGMRWQVLLADIEASGLSQVSFCQSGRVAWRTFQDW